MTGLFAFCRMVAKTYLRYPLHEPTFQADSRRLMRCSRFHLEPIILMRPNARVDKFYLYLKPVDDFKIPWGSGV